MDEVDSPEKLAELEALLYSQIHFSLERNDGSNTTSSDATPNKTATPTGPRYYAAPDQTNPKNLKPVPMGPQIVQPPLLQVIQPTATTSSANGNFPAPFLQIQPTFMPPSINNIVLIPPANKMSRKVRKKIRKMTRSTMLMQAATDAELFKTLSREDRMIVLKIQKRLPHKVRRLERRKQLLEQQLIDDYNEMITREDESHPGQSKAMNNSVIEISDSEAEEVVAIEPAIDVVELSSDDDDENVKPLIMPNINRASSMKMQLIKTKYEDTADMDDDSVEYIEVPIVEPVIFDVESDADTTGRQKTDAELMKPPSDESASSISTRSNELAKKASAASSQARATKNKQRKVVDTPESSNDFLDHTLDVSQQNSMNEKEMHSDKPFRRPRVLVETCDSESSASDMSISLRTPVFNELDFECPPKELFVEGNLDSFSEFITPKRKTTATTSAIDKPALSNQNKDFEQVRTRASHPTEHSDSGSSSESEYEQADQAEITEGSKPMRKRLPSLCDFAEELIVNSPQKAKNDAIHNIDNVAEAMEVEKNKEEGVVKKKTKKKKKQGKASNPGAAKKRKKGEKSKSDTEVEQNIADVAADGIQEEIRLKSKSDSEILATKSMNTESCHQNTSKSPEKSRRSKKRKNSEVADQRSPVSDSSDVVILPQDENDADIISIGASDEIFTVAELDSLEADIELKNISETNDNSWRAPADLSILDNPSSQQENANVENILQSLPSDPKRWKILRSDSLRIIQSPKGPRCNKCREPGHLGRNCKRAVFKCWLCGSGNHLEPRCPNTVCTRCGHPTRFFTTFCGKCTNLVHYTCTTCGNKGHNEELCPDQWRRYHLTSKEGEMNQAGGNLKAPKDRWCSGCGKQGHFEHMCNYYSRTHLPCDPQIFSYTDLYGMTSSADETHSPSKSHREISFMDLSSDNTESECHYKKMEISIPLNVALIELLNEPKAINTLNELAKDLYCTYKFVTRESDAEILFKGHPLDLEKIRRLFQDLIKDHTVNHRRIALNKREFRTISSPKGCEFLKEFSRLFDVSSRIETANSTKVLNLHGDAVSILLVEHRVRSALEITTESHQNCNDVDDTPLILDPANIKTEPVEPRQFSNNARTFKLSKYLRRTLSKASMSKEFIDKVSEENGVTWKILNENLVLDGDPEGIDIVVSQMGDMGSDNCVPCFNTLRRIDKILEETRKENSKSLEELLMNRQYSKLNMILFYEHDFYQGKQIYANLAQLAEDIRDTLVMSKSVYEKFLKSINFIRSVRHHSFYADCINKIREREEKMLNEIPRSASPPINVDQDADYVEPYRIAMQPKQIAHLVETEEGLDFLDELRGEIHLEVNQSESTLILAGLPAQRDKIANKMNFYFKLLSYNFPKAASEIYEDLKNRLTIVHLDYYEKSCQHLYSEIFSDGEPEKHVSSLVKLHGLLFAKHEFLEGAEHVDTLHNYMQVLRFNRDEPLSYSDLRRIKTSAMYLFCPFLMNVNYALLVKLAIGPQLPLLQSIFNTKLSPINDVKRKFEAARQVCGDHTSHLADYLDLIQHYVNHSEFSCESIRVCYAFLKEHFPVIFTTNESTSNSICYID